MRVVDYITRKRDGEELTDSEIDHFIRGYVSGEIPDYQAAAWCMAVYFRGMSEAETTHLTQAMAFSGQTLDLHDVVAFSIDKHSSGGVGDKTSLVIAPMVGSFGIPVAKMSGRGLSFSGGTIDKLQSIPGFVVDLPIERFKRQLAEVGVVIAGQTHELAPADGKLYSLRDVTGTVPSMPLIASSIMSKKIASGADAIVLDVKVGHGAFMDTVADGVTLAKTMIGIGRRLGRKMAALIGDMSQPLGLAVGNALEVREAVDTLRGGGPSDFRDHCVDVAGEMLLLSGLASDPVEGRERAARSLIDGTAWSKFLEFVRAQDGDLEYVERPDRLPSAPIKQPLLADRAGFLSRLDAREVGYVVVELGGGRQRKGDPIDYSVGVLLSDVAKVGRPLRKGEELLQVHARSLADASAAIARLSAAIDIAEQPVQPPPLIHQVLR